MNRPTKAALAAIACSTLLFAQGANAATSTVDYPFATDRIPVYNRLGVYGTTTAAHRWEATGGLDLVPVYAEPASGITLRWNSARAGTTVGGWVDYTNWKWDGRQWELSDCVVNVNTKVAGYGRPYGKWLYAIVTHEVGHCLGWYDHSVYPSIMRTSLNPNKINAGYHPYTPTSNDLYKMRVAYTTN